MLEHDRIDISKGIDIKKQTYQKNLKFVILGIGFKYEPHLFNGCYGLMRKVFSFNDVALIYVKGTAYRTHFWNMSKDDAINIVNDSNLICKMGVL